MPRWIPRCGPAFSRDLANSSAVGPAASSSKDAVSKAGTPYYHFGVDPHYVQVYSETHSRFDPVATLPIFDVGQIVSLPDLVPYDEFCDGALLSRVDAATGLGRLRQIPFWRNRRRAARFSRSFATKRRGIVDDEMRERMALIVPHVRRAVLIGKAIDLKKAEAATFADMLDGLSAGMFLVAADGRIVHANAAGHGMLSAGDCLRSTSGRLVARDRQADKILRETLCGRRRRRRRNRRQRHRPAADHA